MELKRGLRDAWRWLWYSDSLLSWVVSLVLIFLIVKFIAYPVIGFVFGTSLPLVVVESDSMKHPGDFEDWWMVYGKFYEDYGINKEAWRDMPFSNGLYKGDIVVVFGSDFNDLREGDVVIFSPPEGGKAIIHRVVNINSYSRNLETKGDNNVMQLSIEKSVGESQILGKAVLRVPYFGWIKLFIVELFS